jgi:hypothetical protein
VDISREANFQMVSVYCPPMDIRLAEYNFLTVRYALAGGSLPVVFIDASVS